MAKKRKKNEEIKVWKGLCGMRVILKSFEKAKHKKNVNTA